MLKQIIDKYERKKCLGEMLGRHVIILYFSVLSDMAI